jgi:hypothetical protein
MRGKQRDMHFRQFASRHRAHGAARELVSDVAASGPAEDAT